MNVVCVECGAGFVAGQARGRTPRYCSGACRQAAYRARAARRREFMRLAEGRWVRAVGKRPVSVSGAPASSTDSGTWATHAAVIASRAGDGLGVMCGGGLAVHDLDDCFTEDGRLQGWARKVLAGVESPLFVERSQSGRGLHIFVEAPEGRGSCEGHEFYSWGRFVKVTFDQFTDF